MAYFSKILQKIHLSFPQVYRVTPPPNPGETLLDASKSLAEFAARRRQIKF